MAQLRRLQSPKSPEPPAAAAPAPVSDAGGSVSMLDEMEALLTSGSAGSEVESAPAVQSVAQVPAQSPAPALTQPLSAAPEVPKEAAPQTVGVRPAQDYLNVLQALAPVFKAASIYPGHEASPQQLAAAVQLMSRVSVDLAGFISSQADALEVDSGWSRKMLHGFTAQLVSSQWVTSVISKGGVMKGQLPPMSTEQFIPAINAVLTLPVDVAERASAVVSSQASIQVALIAGITPIAIEVERYATIINTRLPLQDGDRVNEAAIINELAQFVAEQSAQHLDRVVADGTVLSDDDRQVIFHTLIQHSSEVVLASWEYCRGEILGVIKEAESAEDAAKIFESSAISHGFPLEQLKTRAAQALKRLTGASQYALTMMRQAATKVN